MSLFGTTHIKSLPKRARYQTIISTEAGQQKHNSSSRQGFRLISPRRSASAQSPTRTKSPAAQQASTTQKPSQSPIPHPNAKHTRQQHNILERLKVLEQEAELFIKTPKRKPQSPSLPKNTTIPKARKSPKTPYQKANPPKPQTPQQKTVSKWLEKHKKHELPVLNLDIKSQDLYSKNKWQKFSMSMFTHNKQEKLSIKAVDKANHKHYIHKVLISIGKQWFYNYAPIEQAAIGIIRTGFPLVVDFRIERSTGKIQNFKIVQKASSTIENTAIRRTFETVKLPLPPDNFLYKSLNMTFQIHNPTRHKTHTIVTATITIEGEYKRINK